MAKRSPPPSTQIKNAWRYTSTVLHVFKVWYLIKLRDKFTVCFYQFAISEAIFKGSLFEESEHLDTIRSRVYLQVCNALKSGRSFPTFRRKALPSFSGSKTKPSKQPTRCKQQTWRWRPKICEHLRDYTASHPRRESKTPGLSPPANYTDRATAVCRRS
jgi:hypothetical protein